MSGRDFLQNNTDRVIARCDHCKIDAPLTPEQVEQWDRDHAHDEEDL